MGRGFGGAKPFPTQQLEKLLRMASPHGCVVLTFGRAMAEVAPPLDHLLRRTATDAQLQARTGDKVSGACVFRHIVRILVPHVDDAGSNFNLPCPGSDSRKKREGRRELPCKVMNPKVGAIHPNAFGFDSEINRLQEHVSR